MANVVDNIVAKLIKDGLLQPGQVTTAQKYLDNLGGIDNLDAVQRNALVSKMMRDIEILDSMQNKKVKPKIQEEDPIDIFDDIAQVEDAAPIKQVSTETNFTLDQVPNSFKKVDLESGETLIKIGRDASGNPTFYKPEEVILKESKGNKYFVLKEKIPSTKDDYMKLGIKFADNVEVQKVMNDYISGVINKTQAAIALDKIPNINKGGKFSNISRKTIRGVQRNLTQPKVKFEPFVNGYLSTLDEASEAVSFSKYLNKSYTGRDVGFDKINQVLNITDTLKNDKFNNIELPDGTLMKNQPESARMYNAYILSGGDTKNASSYGKFIKKYINPYFKFKNPDEVLPNYKKNWKFDTTKEGFIYDTRKGRVDKAIPEIYKPYFNQVKQKMYSVLPPGERANVGGTFEAQLKRMIARAEEDNADPADIIKIIQQIDSKGLADLISKKYSLENKIKILREQALSPSLKNTNPELYVDLTNNSNTGFNVYLIELSHIEDVAQNWRAAFDLNNIFLTHGTFNRRQQFIDRKLTSLLNKFSKAKNLNEKKLILKELRKVEEELVEKNLISKHGDRYFGADMDKVVNEANLLKNVEEAVDYTRYLADGGLVSFEEVLEYNNG